MKGARPQDISRIMRSFKKLTANEEQLKESFARVKAVSFFHSLFNDAMFYDVTITAHVQRSKTCRG